MLEELVIKRRPVLFAVMAAVSVVLRFVWRF
jgi:hypothetical protein